MLAGRRRARPAATRPANPVVASGRARVQDEGSQLAALALSRARPIAPGERWLDLCAGPGGKAALLAAEARAGGATLVANELVPARARLVRNALAVFDPAPEVVEGDGTRFATDGPAASTASCSTPRARASARCGAARRRGGASSPPTSPSSRGCRARCSTPRSPRSKPGGILAYVTCSPHLAETREVVERALAPPPGRSRALDTPAVARSAIATARPRPAGARPHVQLWPHRHGTDAMFIQLLELPDR